ncbi:hypothetical protein HPB49_018407 [Dermacentor silvarum]|uniref:Uncharacterized protein n=1 Tax=Dermacentor silvarum TaxID=543639 RepID=A0ACB8DEG8_DERSI|nr:papilin [Dermacentor silvarum]KAH7966659.1 hypothetical protein HPB49_018407 [Dermacentor silvarum]
MSSSQKVSSSSVKKGTRAAAKEVPARSGASDIQLSSVKIGCLLLVLTVMTVALYLATMPRSHRQDRAVATLIDEDDEAVSQDRGSVKLRPAVRSLPPTRDERPAPSRRMSATEATEAESSSDVDMADNATERMDAPQIFVQTKPRGPCTEKAQFGLCTNENRHEFYFDTEKQQCRSKARQLPPSCLAGQNRFKSFRDCRLACLDQVPEQKCTAEPLYQRCTAEDIARQWWYLKGGRCHPWKFPNSNCVSPRLALFERHEDCHNLCVAGKPVARHPSCSETPVQHVCTALHMVYPVLARSIHKRLTCVQTDHSEPKCLTGSNRFDTEEACQKACLRD